MENSSSRTRITARLAAMSAGWAFSVKVRSDSGPSHIVTFRSRKRIQPQIVRTNPTTTTAGTAGRG